jgi:hypothetical protein
MAIRLSNSFVNTVIPSAYTNVEVKSSTSGVGISGNIIIIGEADGGAYFSSEDLKDNFFTPDQASRVVAKYLKGPIVDAFNALAVPSSDTEITGSPNRVYIIKTNSSTQASASIPSYGSLKDKNYGVDGNKYSVTITESIDEVGPSVTSTALDFTDPSIFDALSFSVRVNGGAASVITLGTGTHANIGALITEIDGLLPVSLECVAGASANTFKIQHVVDSTAYNKGYGKSFELIDSTIGDLSVLEVAAQLYSSSAQPQVQVDINRVDNGTNESFLVDAEVALQVGYVGTTATLTIASGVLSTTVVGGSGSNLSITLSNYVTLSDLADYINSQPGYSASVVAVSTSNSTSVLDAVSAIGICATGSYKPGLIKKSVYNFKSKLAQSVKVDATVTATAGIPAALSKTFFSGGAKGATLAANIVDALVKAETLTANFVIPLFSRDAGLDIAAGLTDSSSTYTIDAIHAAVKNHVVKMSAVKVKKNRQAFLSISDTFNNAKAKASSLANYRVSLAFQNVSVVNSLGIVTEFQPWLTACVAAGMQAAGFYKGITNKFANVISVVDPSGFDSGSLGDLESALESGLLTMAKEVQGNRWVSDQTTYGIDTNFVYNSIQAVYAADLVALDLTQSMQTAFVGKSLADVNASVMLSYLGSKMQSYKLNKLIASSDDAPLGYKNATITISGPVADVQVEIKLATSLYFIAINLQISEITTTA